MDESRLRENLVQAVKQLWMRGLIAGDGGVVSVELHRRRYLTTPMGKRRIDLLPQDLVCVDIGGLEVQGGAGVDEAAWRPHRLAYQSTLEVVHTQVPIAGDAAAAPVRATIFATPPHVVALTMLCQADRELKLAGAAAIAVVEPGDEGQLREALRRVSAVAVRGAGLLVTAAELNQAMNRVELIELAATVEIARHRGC
jgi:ribulose-5-phosphate 4-epimerase/fuculose-1-phosphate aldolase